MPKVKNIASALPEAEQISAAGLAQLWKEGGCDLIVVLGPTASGKTRYAVRLAHELGSLLADSCSGVEIISADSRQVYRRMDIGTGKDLCEYDDIPYHLIDIAEPGEQYNVYRFTEDFRRAWADIISRGALPILCGGTGMYINAVTSGYDFTTRTPLSERRERSGVEGLPRAPYFIGTLVDRDTRNRRIDARLDARLEEGMVDEIRALMDSGVSTEALLGYGLEYRYVTLYLLGELSREEMRERLAIAIHQFAKRQMTWFRGMERSGIRIHWTEA